MKFGNMNDWHSDVQREVAGVPMDIGEGRALIVKRSGARNRELLAAMAECDPKDRAQQEQITARSMVIGWAGIVDADGVAVPYTPENCVALFQFAPDLLDAVVRFAHDRANYQSEEIERDRAAIKNS